MTEPPIASWGHPQHPLDGRNRVSRAAHARLMHLAQSRRREAELAPEHLGEMAVTGEPSSSASVVRPSREPDSRSLSGSCSVSYGETSSSLRSIHSAKNGSESAYSPLGRFAISSRLVKAPSAFWTDVADRRSCRRR